jgi:hypothetical protein
VPGAGCRVPGRRSLPGLHAKIGELIWNGIFSYTLRPMSVARRRDLVAPHHQHLSIVRQCELLSFSWFRIPPRAVRGNRCLLVSMSTSKKRSTWSMMN